MIERMWILALIIFCGLAAGCARVPNTRYYTLIYPRSRPALAQSASGATLAIDRVLADSLHRQTQLIYYTPPNVVNLYFYHRWAAPPPEMMARRLHEQFEAAGLFQRISLYAPGEETDYVLRATIVRLEEIDEPQQARVMVELSAKLLDGRTGQVVWTGTGADQRAVSLTSMEEIVDAMNEAVEASVSQLIDGVRRTLASTAPESSDVDARAP